MPPPETPPVAPTSLLTPSDLISFSRVFLDWINQRHFDLLATGLQHLLAPEFRADLVYDGAGFPYDAFILQLQDVCREFPTFRYELNSVEISCNERAGYADVFADLNVLGRPEGIRKRAISVLRFRKDGEKWIWFQNKSVGLAAG